MIQRPGLSIFQRTSAQQCAFIREHGARRRGEIFKGHASMSYHSGSGIVSTDSWMPFGELRPEAFPAGRSTTIVKHSVQAGKT